MELKKKIVYVLLLLLIFPVSVSANDPFAKLPSEQTRSQISEMASLSDRYPTRDWWNGSGLSDGPPTEGGGGGGAVGMPLADGTLPIVIAGLVYFSCVAIKRNRRNKQHC